MALHGPWIQKIRAACYSVVLKPGHARSDLKSSICNPVNDNLYSGRETPSVTNAFYFLGVLSSSGEAPRQHQLRYLESLAAFRGAFGPPRNEEGAEVHRTVHYGTIWETSQPLAMRGRLLHHSAGQPIPRQAQASFVQLSDGKVQASE